MNITSRFGSSFEEADGYTLSEASQSLAALFFDLRTVHFLCSGSNFYTYHELAQELYEKTEDFYDDLVETAISYDESVQPMFVLPGDWESLGSNFAGTDEPELILLPKLEEIYDVLQNVIDYDSSVQSKLDSMMEYYDKEIYKLERAVE